MTYVIYTVDGLECFYIGEIFGYVYTKSSNKESILNVLDVSLIIKDNYFLFETDKKGLLKI